ncbi:MAG: energy-coupled thiamine transporter ThiT [Coriobacteriales bacterium]|jgi:thiamine transporter|nr:energy-coupled thiamine transporter ThiT [Coriobacteriales bacterium]
MRNTRILILVEVALAVALAAVLNAIQARLPLNVAGGSVNLCMLPIAVVALRRGALAGATAGALFGLIDFLLEPFFLFPLQVILDYPAPYLLFGLGVGLFSRIYNKAAEKDERRVTGLFIAQSTGVIIGALLVGGTMRLVSHVLSGVLFFAEYAADFFADYPVLLQAGAADTGLNVWIYSTVYNLLYIIPSVAGALICVLVVMPVLAKAVPAQRIKAQVPDEARVSL